MTDLDMPIYKYASTQHSKEVVGTATVRKYALIECSKLFQQKNSSFGDEFVVF